MDHIIVDHIGACVASTLDEMEWNAHDWVYDRWSYYQEGQTCLHIGHLVPLERSNFAYVLGTSGVVN